VCDCSFGEIKVHRDPATKKLRGSGPAILSGEPFTHKVRLMHDRHSVLLWANRNTISIMIYGHLPHGAFCSINHPDANDFMRPTQLQAEGDQKYPVFISSQSDVTDGLRMFLSSSNLQQAVRDLIRHDEDSLHFRADCAHLYFRPDSELEITEAIGSLSALVGPFIPERESWELAALPAEFRGLIPLIRKWAECDDDVRSDLVREASDLSLRQLIQTVSPFFETINKFLSSFGEHPLPEAAIALQALAECAAEAQICMKDRSDMN
jgi:hypothetical protein